MFLNQKQINRFWSGVNCQGPNGCWPWAYFCHPKGGGQFRLNGRIEYTHRISWTFSQNRQIPELFEDLPSMICHTCDNPPCCNPTHLFLGNSKINQKDSVVKDRRSYLKLWLKGENSFLAKKTNAQICEVKIDLEENLLTQTQIAVKHGLSRQAVSLIKTGKRWSYIK